ncbi:K(+)/H(+) antiporter NhaP2 [Methanobrevibacter cuticularis]|uniref:K(+)/H(+) antiporter NhaP2 n=1 Tax=Methanobrevibacter cuticularis TaxID=47311 RepID=A0A166EQP8_9EURY|nr:cation:proton antiporter [Methanobrevibacter cuticularis]KZX16906.1 K(+)/H(+) antiporter NhaP2 [Methanobrevibacter cuticularis]
MDQITVNLGIIIVLGIISTKLLDRFQIPGFIGLIGIGVLLGPFGFNFLHGTFLALSRELATLAIVILLIRAGLGISQDSIRKAGRPAITMGFLPSIFEGMSVAIIAPFILGISFIEGGMLGFVLGAVAPAILVPSMLSLMDRGLGTKKSIPTILLAGASADDVVAITIFSSFLGVYFGTNVNIAWIIIGIPISLILGLISGFLIGIILLNLFRKWDFSPTEKVLMILSAGLLLNGLSQALDGIVPIAGLLGVMVIGFMMFNRTPKVAIKLSNKFRKIWVLAEIVVFVMLGAQLNVSLAVSLLIPGLAIVSFGLLFRSIGVYVSLLGTNLNLKEKIFSMIAYFPKATVQATIGAIPFAMGIASGEIIIAIAAIGIIFSAPIGAIGIRVLGDKLLTKDT